VHNIPLGVSNFPFVGFYMARFLITVCLSITITFFAFHTNDTDNAKQRVDQARESVVISQDGLKDANDSLASAYGEANAAYARKSHAAANSEYDTVVREGRAGTTEMLLLAKRMIDNPSYMQKTSADSARAQNDITRNEWVIESRKEERKVALQVNQAASIALDKAEAHLRKTGVEPANYSSKHEDSLRTKSSMYAFFAYMGLIVFWFGYHPVLRYIMGTNPSSDNKLINEERLMRINEYARVKNAKATINNE
jgi:hypothetical protein